MQLVVILVVIINLSLKIYGILHKKKTFFYIRKYC